MSSKHKNKETTVQLFKKYVFSPFQNRNFTTNQDQIQYIVQEIYNWARSNGAEYISFLSYPIRNQIAEKQTTFLHLKFLKDNLFESIGSEKITLNNIFSTQINGDSIPNGSLRQCHQSRAYLLWDHHSQLYIRKKQGILYIPCFIISPSGYKLDDRSHFRKAQKVFQCEFGNLLKKLGIEHKGVFFGVGLQQEFFIIPKQVKQKRLDIKQTGRMLIGSNSTYYPEQQNYLQKIPNIIEETLRQVEHQLLQLGVPIKARSSSGAPNQFKLITQVQNASLAIDHNALVQQVLEQICDRNGLSVLFHQKPFKKLNGSGKHLNWSISYLNNQQKLVNVCDRKLQNKQLLSLMILMILKAEYQNYKLLIASTINPGNQIRLGQQGAPPHILSYSLGSQIQFLIQGLCRPHQKNLKQRFTYLLKDFNVQVGQRNRTSSMAYSSNKFQFRLCGSNNNPTFAIIVIMATLVQQFKSVIKQLERGQLVKDIICQYRQLTRKVRYQGNCYSQQWKKQAQRRGIFNPKMKYTDFIKAVTINGRVLVDARIYGIKQLQARQKIMRKQYIDVVLHQKNILLKIINKNIVPRSFSLVSSFPRQLHLKHIQLRMKKVDLLLEQLLKKTQQLQKMEIIDQDLEQAYNLRQKIFQLSECAGKLMEYLPQNQNFPQLHQFINKWKSE